MHIGILKADSVLPQFQPDFGDYPQMFRDLLGEASHDVTFTVFDVEHGEYPEDISVCDGYVITGSKKSVYDDEPWIRALKAFVVKLHETQTKTVGICFGHQLIADSLGGKTEPAALGWGVGVHRSKWVGSSRLFDSAGDFSLLVSHKDQVTTLPPGAELLASNDFCPNAMFRIGDHFLTFQGHPEFSKGYSNALMEFRADILGSEKFEAGVTSLTEPLDNERAANWILTFLGEKTHCQS